ncbi:MAG: hypothetical protein GY775_12410 [Candidatus Scalindua sp.]|nr:hypothetical protein [Candidatus Scalindua sp.]
MNTKEDIARIILNYLSKNPDAGDTLEGISRWWLNRDKIDVAVDEIAGVLEALIKEGLIEKQTMPGDNANYKVCSDR